MPKVNARGEQPKGRDDTAVTQTEPNGTDKPLPRTGPKGSGAVYGTEETKPAQRDERKGPGKGT